jgi:hypothetical protein
VVHCRVGVAQDVLGVLVGRVDDRDTDNAVLYTARPSISIGATSAS